MKKNINDMKRKDFDKIPLYSDELYGINSTMEDCSSLVLLPGRSRELHDSGYRLIDAVVCREGNPICRLGSPSDVLHFAQSDIDWSMDCLPTSGLFRIFLPGETFNVFNTGSDITVCTSLKKG